MVCPLMTQSGHRRGVVNGLQATGATCLANCAHSATTIKKECRHISRYLSLYARTSVLRLFALLRIHLLNESCVTAGSAIYKPRVRMAPRYLVTSRAVAASF